MTLLFGNLTAAFVEFGATVDAISRGQLDPSALGPVADHFKHTAAQNALWLTLIGVGMFAATFAYSYIWVYTGEVSTKRLRERYLQSILRQEIAYFDNVGAGEVATRIQTDTREFCHANLRRHRMV
jgi:ATP-binding cassette subfamily B (MDR/TAP) protein 1